MSTPDEHTTSDASDIPDAPMSSAAPADREDDTLILPGEVRDDPAPTPAQAPAAGSRRRRVRVGTVVWGLVVAVCGVLALAVAGGAHIDGGTVAIAVLGGAGLALVVGSVITGVRRRDDG
jgi:hypothetical protein